MAKLANVLDLGSSAGWLAGSSPVARTITLKVRQMSMNCCCNTYTPSSYNAYTNFCDPFRYSQAVDGKYIKYNGQSCLKCQNTSTGLAPRPSCDCDCGKQSSKKKSKYYTTWSGEYPFPYRGVWTLYQNGKDISFMIPTHLRVSPMYTYGEFPVYYLQPGQEVTSFVKDGLRPPEWIYYNWYWLSMIADENSDLLSLYIAFNANDWRYAPIAPPPPGIHGE